MDEKLIQQRLKNDINIAVKEIVSALPDHPKAILLSGGYGRGEGAWYENAEGYPEPYNDYDFSVITEYKLSAKEYKELREKIAKKVNIQWIDIAFYKPYYFKRVKPTIKNIDLIYASKIVYGDASFLKNININAKKIGNSDIIKLYKTRLWTFLGSWDGDFRDLNIEETRFFLNQMAKAVLAACDMLLVSKKLYTPLYTERIAIILKIFSNDRELCEMAEWALNEKKRPSSNRISKDKMENTYWRVKRIFNQSMRESLPKQWKYFANPDLTKRFSVLKIDFLIHVIYDLIVKRSKRTQKHIDIICAQNYIFHANNMGVINDAYIDKGAQIMLSYGYTVDPSKDWNKLRSQVAWARNNL